MLLGAITGLAKSVDNAFPLHDIAYHCTSRSAKDFCGKLAMKRDVLKRLVLRLLSEMSPVRIRPGSPTPGASGCLTRIRVFRPTDGTKMVTAQEAKQKLT